MKKMRVLSGNVRAWSGNRHGATVALRVATDVEATFDLYHGATDRKVATIRGPFDGQIAITLETDEAESELFLRADERVSETEAAAFIPAPNYREVEVKAVEIAPVTPLTGEPVKRGRKKSAA